MAREALEVCLLVLKESNKSRFDSSVGQEQCIDHIPYYLSGLSRAHFFRQSTTCLEIAVHGPSLHSKRFRLVSGQRKTEERDSRFWPREK